MNEKIITFTILVTSIQHQDYSTMATTMEDQLQVTIAYIKPSLMKGASATSRKPETEVDVPDLATSYSWSDGEDSKQRKDQNQDVIISIDDSLSTETWETDDVSEGESSSHPSSPPSCSWSGLVYDLLAAAMHEEKGDSDCEQHSRRHSLSRIPSSIILLEDNLWKEGADDVTTCPSMEERLQCAEALMKSYRATTQSNEHLLDSLYQTLAETREQAQNLLADRNELVEAIDLLHKEQEDADHVTNDRRAEPKYFVRMAMTISLMLYLSGIASEYALVATVVVYLLEDVL
jgi:hypothetical protein